MFRLAGIEATILARVNMAPRLILAKAVLYWMIRFVGVTLFYVSLFYDDHLLKRVRFQLLIR